MQNASIARSNPREGRGTYGTARAVNWAESRRRITQSTANFDNARSAAWTAGLELSRYDGSVPKLVRAAGCDTWSSFFRNLTPAAIDEGHAIGLTVLPWTVNDPADMARLIDMKVDGLITDYPDRARKAMADKGIPLPPGVGK